MSHKINFVKVPHNIYSVASFPATLNVAVRHVPLWMWLHSESLFRRIQYQDGYGGMDFYRVDYCRYYRLKPNHLKLA